VILSLAIASTWDGHLLSADQVASIGVRRDEGELVLEIEAPFADDPAPPTTPGSTPGLWDFEVVELFLLGQDERYLEIEMGPHGHFLVLELQGRRHVVREEIPIVFTAHIARNRWTGTARIPVGLLPPTPLRANAYRIQGTGPARRYFAHAAVPGPAPDFHRLESFVPWTVDSAP
jgi:hypothetical protein